MSRDAPPDGAGETQREVHPSDAAVAEPGDAPLEAGEVLAGRYEVRRFIAGGAMGEVYEAIDLELGERVALKRILPALASSREVMARFRREIQLARRVTHPNVCRLFDLAFHRDGRGTVAFLTMELLGGETLADRLGREGRLESGAARAIVDEVAAGLGAAHAAGIIHRDLKSQNILLTPRGAVITDFGVAVAAYDPGEGVTGTGAVVGTPAYMAPEQVEGGEVTAAADIYALGVVMYEMVTGERPFTGGSSIAVAARRLQRDPAPPRRLAPELDRRWNDAILRCLRRDPGERFPRPADILAALDAAPRRRRGRLTLLVVAGLAASGAILAMRPSSSVTAPARVAVRAVAILSPRNIGPPDDAWLATAISELLRGGLAGTDVRVLAGDDVARAQRELAVADDDPAALARLGVRLGADVLVFGTYRASGDGDLRLDVRAIDTATATVLHASGSSGPLTGLDGLVGGASGRLRAALRTGGPAVLVAGASTPRSPLAMRRYAEGLARMRSFELPAAKDLLAQAIAAEPTFPLAYAALAQVSIDLGNDDDEALRVARRAVELSGTLPVEERLRIAARYHEIAGDREQAVAIYRSLFDLFPGELAYGLPLAHLLAEIGQGDEALAIIARLRAAPRAAVDPRLDLEEGLATGDSVVALRLFERAAAAAEQRGARGVQAQALTLAASLQMEHGHPEAALASGDRALALHHALGDRIGEAVALTMLTPARAQSGDYPGAFAQLERAVALALAAGSKRHAVEALMMLAEGRLRSSELGAARRALERVQELGLEDDPLWAHHNAWLRFEEGDLAGAEQILETALQHLEGHMRGRLSLLLAEVLLARGDVARAKQLTDASEVEYTRVQSKTSLLWIRVVRARIQLESGKAAEAATLAGDAASELAIANPVLYPVGLAVQARALAATGRDDEARRALAPAFAVWSLLPLTHRVAVASAAANAGGGEEDRARLESVLREADAAAVPHLRFEAGLALAAHELAAGRGPAARARLVGLEKQARALGFVVVARHAADLRRGSRR